MKSGDSFQFLKHFDVYTKVEEDYRVRTSWGASLSILGWVVIAMLVTGEIRNHVAVLTREHMSVDTSIGLPLQINVNITFHSLNCAEVHLDAMDVAGDNQINIEHDMLKQRISPSGFPIGMAAVALVGEEEALPPLPDDYCGPCFGAQSPQFKCCNTCTDLRNAYDAKGWTVAEIIRTAEQCLRDNTNPFAAVKKGEGCRLVGVMKVNKVSGNFHMALGDSIVRDGHHIHQFVPSEAPGFNVSHTIHELSFGRPFPSMPSNPLDDVERFVDEKVGTGLFQYFIRVIPTVFVSRGGQRIETNQYTFTERFRPVLVPSTDGGAPALVATVLPGVFFVYELAPFVVEVTDSRPPLLHLLTRILAITGGIFSLLGVLDGVLFRLQKLMTKKV